MNVICMEEEAFYALIETVVERLTREQPKDDWPWVGQKEAMRLLGVKAPTTMQNLRDFG